MIRLHIVTSMLEGEILLQVQVVGDNHQPVTTLAPGDILILNQRDHMAAYIQHNLDMNNIKESSKFAQINLDQI